MSTKTDIEHIRLLAIFHFILGALAGLCGCLPIFHLAVGIAMVSGSLPQGQGPPPPPGMGWVFIVFAAAGMLYAWALAIGLVSAGFMLQRRRGYLFCLVMAGIACLWMPMGTVLGVFTFIVLLRPSVKELFGRKGSVQVDDRIERTF
jgi:hypothetical protein